MFENENTRNHALKVIYQTNKMKIYTYVLSNSGNATEAKDVFQETIIAFYENVRDHKFKGESAISTYLYSIAKFKWLNQLKKKGLITSHLEKLEKNDELYKNPLDIIISKEQKIQVIEILSQLGDSCKKLLIENIYHDKSMKEIVKNSKYSSEQVARNKKYKCMQRLKELIAEKPQLMEILRNNE